MKVSRAIMEKKRESDYELMAETNKNEIKISMDTTSLDIAQEKADRLLETLQKIHELIQELKSIL